MNKFKVFLFFLFFINLTIYGQIDNPIATLNQNKFWIDSLEKASLELQIDMIKHRIIQDTAVYVPNMTVPTGILQDKLIYTPQCFVPDLKLSDLANDSFEINGVKGQSSILFSCSYRNGNGKYSQVFIKRDMTTHISQLQNIVNLFSEEFIKNVEIIKPEDKEIIIYGTNHSFGVITIEIENKRLYKRIEKLNE